MHHQQSLFYGSNQENAIEVVQRKLMQQNYGQCNTVVKECNFLNLQNLNLIKLMTALDSCDQIPADASPCHSAEIDSMCLAWDRSSVQLNQLNSTDFPRTSSCVSCRVAHLCGSINYLLSLRFLFTMTTKWYSALK